MSQKPRIGITLDSVDPAQQPEGSWYHLEPWYALRYRYVEAVEQAGGIPLNLSYHQALVDDYVDALDGLLITGGGFDVDPALYGINERHPTVTVKPDRTAFEYALCRAFLAAKKPILGICGGMQLLNVACGGTLHQHVPEVRRSEGTEPVEHSPKIRAFLTAHDVQIIKGTRLSMLYPDTSCAVNSVHHQAVDRIGQDLRLSATADDGIVEAIESTIHPFVVGIQWHPEFLIHDLDKNIFNAFIASAQAQLKQTL
jgi:putative glutamine amidotransferase